MELLPKDLRETLPKLYKQEGNDDPTVYLKFFFPVADWTWFVTEGEQTGEDFTFFGYVIGLENEWGYFSLRELQSVNIHHLTVERDLDFQADKFSGCVRRWKQERGASEMPEGKF